MLKVNDINVYYGAIHAIKGISFEVQDGEIVTLLGANGAGKSTTLNTLAGLLHSQTGSVEFLGQSLAGVPAHRMDPDWAFTRPVMVRRVVDLPAPLAPIRVTILPSGTSREMPRRAWMPP